MHHLPFTRRAERIKSDYKELKNQYDSLKQKQTSQVSCSISRINVVISSELEIHLQRYEAERASLLSTSIAPGGLSTGGAAMQQRRIVSQSTSLGGNESPFSYSQRTTPDPSSRGYLSAGSSNPSSSYGNRASTKNLYTPRTNAALDENSFINDTGNQLDAFIAQGQAILGNLGNQRDILKSGSLSKSVFFFFEML